MKNEGGSGDRPARRREALALSRASEGLVTLRLSVPAEDVVFVKGILEASDGVASMFAERGGELTIAAPASREAEARALVADLIREIARAEARDAERFPVPAASHRRRDDPGEPLSAVHPPPSSLVAAEELTSISPLAAPEIGGVSAMTSSTHGPDDRAAGGVAAGAADETVVTTTDRSGEGREAMGAALDPRIVGAWKRWLAALATDAEAALAASQVYDALDEAGRDALLDALSEDIDLLGVPRVAVFAPLLAVERDPTRADRIAREIEVRPRNASEVGGSLASAARALRGVARDGARVLVVVAPLYLRFVRILRCQYTLDGGFLAAEIEALSGEERVPSPGTHAFGALLERVPVKVAIEELSLAILAQRRKGASVPDALRPFADLWDAPDDSE